MVPPEDLVCGEPSPMPPPIGTSESMMLMSSKPVLQRSRRSSSGRRKLATSSGKSDSDSDGGSKERGAPGGRGGKLDAKPGSFNERASDDRGDVSELDRGDPAQRGSRGR